MDGCRRLGIACSLMAAFTAPGCSSGLAAYDDLLVEARRCHAQEACTVAGGVEGCRCPSAVRADAATTVDAAARGASCPARQRLYCPPLVRSRCDQGSCLADVVVQ
ncbi:hypothetical protein OOT46_08835 [Aquabacterium sp. A7-Y]|uniref:hypothetical protein n=1 Tax=Aquabacterium sp. A7-Y TaxID=1349605 RepID=UPI00223D1C4D|nr:hypothetical protein [Aquabacterium sp. A7-Y]MCW7537954.1 hypothetical protein [Aquabacterium sp. A7-Y]